MTGSAQTVRETARALLDKLDCELALPGSAVAWVPEADALRALKEPEK